MSMINKGIPYFPTPANFFDEEVMELLEAKYGCLLYTSPSPRDTR